MSSLNNFGQLTYGLVYVYGYTLNITTYRYIYIYICKKKSNYVIHDRSKFKTNSVSQVGVGIGVKIYKKTIYKMKRNCPLLSTLIADTQSTRRIEAFQKLIQLASILGPYIASSRSCYEKFWSRIQFFCLSLHEFYQSPSKILLQHTK